MDDKPNDLLLLAGRVLTYLIQAILVVGSLALTIAIGAVIFAQDTVMAEIATKHAEKVNDAASLASFPTFTIVAMLILGLCMIAAAFMFFGKLRNIINSVGEGDPFAPENAERLSSMAWLTLAFYGAVAAMTLLAVSIEKWAQSVGDGDFSVSVDFDLSSLLMIVVLFILARVFRHGANMRADLEGTV
jgi:hypothetical protein